MWLIPQVGPSSKPGEGGEMSVLVAHFRACTGNHVARGQQDGGAHQSSIISIPQCHPPQLKLFLETAVVPDVALGESLAAGHTPPQ